MSLNALHKNAIGGSREAEEKLFDALTTRFRLFAQQKVRDRADCEEIVQDALVVILKKFRDIEFQTSFIAWAHRVLNNKIMDFVKTKTLHQKKLVQIADESPGPEHNTNPDLEARLLKCLKKLHQVNARHARVLNLHYQGYTVEDICAKLKVSRTNLYSIMSRARSMLENCLAKGDVH